jgi:hypothetical protein
VRSPREARNPSAMVLGCSMGMICPAAFDRAASSAPDGSAAIILMLGLRALAASAIPDNSPPPVKSVKQQPSSMQVPNPTPTRPLDQSQKHSSFLANPDPDKIYC